jgi:hypothetical protein
MIIRALLIAGALGLGAYLLRERAPGQHLAARRIFGLGIVGLAIGAVLFPSVLTRIANVVGVGRGTDLVLYVLAMVFLFTTASTYQRISHLETRITQLTRALALRDGERSPSSDGDQ